jgi:hypothetical protein
MPGIGGADFVQYAQAIPVSGSLPGMASSHDPATV